MSIMTSAKRNGRADAPEASNLRLPQPPDLGKSIADSWRVVDEDALRAARILADEALIAEALGRGQVTRCPPGRALNAGELRPVRNPLLARGVMSVNWRSGKGQA